MESDNVMRMTNIDPDDYTPIDISKIKKEHTRFYNIPNSSWDEIEIELKNINEKDLPKTLRSYIFEHLPFCVVKFIIENSKC